MLVEKNTHFTTVKDNGYAIDFHGNTGRVYIIDRQTNMVAISLDQLKAMISLVEQSIDYDTGDYVILKKKI